MAISLYDHKSPNKKYSSKSRNETQAIIILMFKNTIFELQKLQRGAEVCKS